MESVTVKLSAPVEYKGTTYKELTFRAAKTGDFAAADAVQGEFSKTLAVIAGMAGIPYPAAKEIEIGDFTKIVNKVTHLMGESTPPADGSTS